MIFTKYVYSHLSLICFLRLTIVVLQPVFTPITPAPNFTIIPPARQFVPLVFYAITNPPLRFSLCSAWGFIFGMSPIYASGVKLYNPLCVCLLALPNEAPSSNLFGNWNQNNKSRKSKSGKKNKSRNQVEKKWRLFSSYFLHFVLRSQKHETFGSCSVRKISEHRHGETWSHTPCWSSSLFPSLTR